jgi:phosphatidylethanolamine-binding protein (PEBP) family uncharacterized protein
MRESIDRIWCFRARLISTLVQDVDARHTRSTPARTDPMQLISQSFQDGQRIPGEFAFAVPDAASHVALSSNRNPHLAWSDVPDGTRSFVLVCHDPDVPSKGDDVNQEAGRFRFPCPVWTSFTGCFSTFRPMSGPSPQALIRTA